MKIAYALMFSAMLAFVACGDDSSSSSVPESSDSSKPASSNDNANFDCTTDSVKVVAPAKGDEFKVGDTIAVVFGSSLDFGGFGIEYRFDGGEKKIGLLEEAVDGETDGKTCNEVKVVLSVECEEDEECPSIAADDAYIRVYPYSKQAKGSNSGTIKVTE
ncbi:MAG: hypothetical protein K6E57_08525 [Fibrobacter sp.]|jgi:hypothetical protein|uniref:hypothetical protein n=1 Tax=Fibrobacter sp. UWP2 TaxID=1896216 RepID=UPI0009213AED|nr:hypothetical protein [Fibrobacter sp. UWP2]MBO7384188.1 hypothetical protein [Fibrobacter sp.]MCR5378982.1 hypothetical protein [Fibrobacter sp.]SHI28924.1 hypothetical protein SAMN05720471_1015 [Fibrobacter sp. UWP2]